MSQQRLEKLRHKMEAQGMEAMLVSKRENIRYLSGFTAGSDALLLISLQDQSHLHNQQLPFAPVYSYKPIAPFEPNQLPNHAHMLHGPWFLLLLKTLPLAVPAESSGHHYGSFSVRSPSGRWLCGAVGGGIILHHPGATRYGIILSPGRRDIYQL
jgi:hypothetical protein